MLNGMSTFGIIPSLSSCCNDFNSVLAPFAKNCQNLLFLPQNDEERKRNYGTRPNEVYKEIHRMPRLFKIYRMLRVIIFFFEKTHI